MDSSYVFQVREDSKRMGAISSFEANLKIFIQQLGWSSFWVKFWHTPAKKLYLKAVPKLHPCRIECGAFHRARSCLFQAHADSNRLMAWVHRLTMETFRKTNSLWSVAALLCVTLLFVSTSAPRLSRTERYVRSTQLEANQTSTRAARERTLRFNKTQCRSLLRSYSILEVVDSCPTNGLYDLIVQLRRLKKGSQDASAAFTRFKNLTSTRRHLLKLVLNYRWSWSILLTFVDHSTDETASYLAMVIASIVETERIVASVYERVGTAPTWCQYLKWDNSLKFRSSLGITAYQFGGDALNKYYNRLSILFERCASYECSLVRFYGCTTMELQQEMLPCRAWSVAENHSRSLTLTWRDFCEVFWCETRAATKVQMSWHSARRCIPDCIVLWDVLSKLTRFLNLAGAGTLVSGW